ncbi:hypothetical protein EDC02_0884 [Micromonospora sp. Llam0]|nr:hypothetical protein [Micromonospora sp. Llam0]ROO59098.1 hypothetical protein EDC02_0884 [Micromonospora sp. Llam0]
MERLVTVRMTAYSTGWPRAAFDLAVVGQWGAGGDGFRVVGVGEFDGAIVFEDEAAADDGSFAGGESERASDLCVHVDGLDAEKLLGADASPAGGLGGPRVVLLRDEVRV